MISIKTRDKLIHLIWEKTKLDFKETANLLDEILKIIEKEKK